MTLSEAFELWMQHKNYSERCRRNIRRRVYNHLHPLLQTPVEKIKNQELSDLINIMHTNKLKDCTISMLCREIRETFLFLVEQGLIEKTPYSDDLDPKGKANLFYSFSDDEELLLRNSIPRIPLNKLFQFCFDSGIKSNEARGLLTENVHPETNEIDILYTVTEDPAKIIPLEVPKKYIVSSNVINALNIQAFNSELLFPNANGNLISTHEVSKNSHLLTLLTNVPNITLNHLAKNYRTKEKGIKENDSNKTNDIC